QLMANAAQVGEHLLAGLRAMQQRISAMGDVRGRGLMVGVEIVNESGEPAKFLANAIMEEAFRRGLLLLTCGASTIRFCPPLIITASEVDQGLAIFEDAIRACV